METIHDTLKNICNGRSDTEDSWNHFYAWFNSDKTEPECLEYILNHPQIDEWIKYEVIKKVSAQTATMEVEKRLLLSIYDPFDKMNTKKKEEDLRAFKSRHFSKINSCHGLLLGIAGVSCVLFDFGIFTIRDVFWVLIIMIAISLVAIKEWKFVKGDGSLNEVACMENNSIKERLDFRLVRMMEEDVELNGLHKVITDWNAKKRNPSD